MAILIKDVVCVILEDRIFKISIICLCLIELKSKGEGLILGLFGHIGNILLDLERSIRVIFIGDVVSVWNFLIEVYISNSLFVYDILNLYRLVTLGSVLVEIVEGVCPVILIVRS